MMGGHNPFPQVVTEETWSQDQNMQNLVDAYGLSKTLAEKAAWDYQKSLPESERFELCTINPGLVLGPAFVGKGFASGEVIEMFMTGKYPGQPRIQMAIVDVREVALAHLNAITIPEAAGRRFILVNQSLWFTEIAQILYDNYSQENWPIKTGQLPYCLVCCMACCNSEVRQLKSLWDVQLHCDNTPSQTILQINYQQDFQKVIVEMVNSMITTGVLENPNAPKQANSGDYTKI